MHEGVADNVVGQLGEYYHGCVEMHLDFLVGKRGSEVKRHSD